MNKHTAVIHSVPDAFGVHCITTIPKEGPWHPATRLTDAEYRAATSVVDFDLGTEDGQHAHDAYWRRRESG